MGVNGRFRAHHASRDERCRHDENDREKSMAPQRGLRHKYKQFNVAAPAQGCQRSECLRRSSNIKSHSLPANRGQFCDRILLRTCDFRTDNAPAQYALLI